MVDKPTLRKLYIPPEMVEIYKILVKMEKNQELILAELRRIKSNG